MNKGSMGIKLVRDLTSFIGIDEKVNEVVMNKFLSEINGKYDNDLLETVRCFIALTAMSIEDKKQCLEHLLQNRMIKQDNFKSFLEVFPEFEERMISMKPFLEH